MTAESDKVSVGDMSEPPGSAHSDERPPESTMSETENVDSDAAIDIVIENIAIHCAMTGNTERFIQCFENDDDIFHETVTDMVNQRGDNGKSPLDTAASLGRAEMLKELIERGADVCSTAGQGYSALHYAAAWGKVECLKALTENGADLHHQTKNGERAKDISVRYNHSECVDYLEWAEAKHSLQQAIQLMKDTLTDPEKVQGKLTREDKNVTNGICHESLDWIETTPEATTLDFLSKKQEFEEALAHIWEKINEPLPEKPEKKHQAVKDGH